TDQDSDQHVKNRAAQVKARHVLRIVVQVFRPVVLVLQARQSRCELLSVEQMQIAFARRDVEGEAALLTLAFERAELRRVNPAGAGGRERRSKRLLLLRVA